MKLGLLFLIASLAWPQISGRVVNSVTGEGVRRALVQIVGQGNSGTNAVITTNAQDEFRFERLVAGEYEIGAYKTGFLRANERYAISAGARKQIRFEE
ncbi:MAG: hypothetical protein OHK0021_14250 [Bryobacter sp.]